MGVVGPPHQVIYANVVAELDAQVILLEADEYVVAKEIAGEGIALEARDVLPLYPVFVRCCPFCP